MKTQKYLIHKVLKLTKYSILIGFISLFLAYLAQNSILPVKETVTNHIFWQIFFCKICSSVCQNRFIHRKTSLRINQLNWTLLQTSYITSRPSINFEISLNFFSPWFLESIYSSLDCTDSPYFSFVDFLMSFVCNFKCLWQS